MSCCNTTITSFSNESVTTVPYTGAIPTVNVVYLQPDNTLQQAGIFTKIEVTATDIIVSHGGLASGYIALL